MDKEISGGGDGGGCGGYSTWWRRNYSRGAELGPPAFLTKTYTIVDDPDTNSIISWGKYGNSFIIWDHLTFSAEILPKYFKHSNLSSFVYQLNSYGFRKIGVDHQWEYNNPGFQKGELNLLKTIRRRGQNPEHVARKRAKRTISDRNVPLETMVNEINESKKEIKKMKSQQADMEFHIMALEEEAKNADNETKKLIACWGRVCDLIAEKMREETGKGEKNSKLLDIDHEINEDVDGENDQDQEKIMKLAEAIPLPDQNQTVSSTNENDDHGENAINSESTQEKNSVDYAYWNSILLGDDDDDEPFEGEGETETAKKKAKIALEFENLIIKLEGYE